MYEEFDLKDVLSIQVDQDRVERLKKLTRLDIPEDTPEIVKDFILRQQIESVNIQYARFLAGIKVTKEDVEEVLEGAIDIHAHGGSEPFERLALEDEVVKDFTKAKMRAVVFKTWYTPSASRIALINKTYNEWLTRQEEEYNPLKVFGGITLNYSVGGINPKAVEKCLGFPGFKYVWMPMVDSYHHHRVVYDDYSGTGIRILDDNRKPLPELVEILKIAADRDLIIASGHYPYEDTLVLMEEAKKMGVKRMELVHPAHIHSKLTIKQMKEFAAEGVKVMLSGLGMTAYPLHETGPVYAARIVNEVGADNVVFGSDYGQIHNPPHIVAVRWVIQLLLAYGISKEEVKKVMQITPAKHLGLND